jgi:GNAT superfamily N-acetyltransferase
LTARSALEDHARMDFAAVERTDLATFADWLDSLSGPIDSYLQEHVADSAFYRISDDGTEVGFFAIHEESLLTQFFLIGAARRFGQPVLARILADYPVTAAYVATFDNFLLAHVLDREHVLKRQAYFFTEGVPGPVPLETTLDYRLATPADAGLITAVSGDFLDRLDERIAGGEIHVGWDGTELVAVGIAEPGALLAGRASIGMFTHTDHRKRGIGTTTIRYLRNVCHTAGVTPLAGCWYYNANSKLTLEAAGMVTTNRLLRIEF